MIHTVDAQLREEARRFHLVFACPDCVSFDDAGARGRCSLGFPHEPHREADLEGRDHVVFCKAFEAW